jgi:hypothetical protein
MGMNGVRREVAKARSRVEKLRFVGKGGWSEVVYSYDADATYEEALEAAEVALAQAEELLAAELTSKRSQ